MNSVKLRSFMLKLLSIHANSIKNNTKGGKNNVGTISRACAAIRFRLLWVPLECAIN